MPDLPDWWQGFQLVGSDITINVNIETSDITMPVSVDAATATIDVNLESSDVTLPISIVAATATVDVNLAAQVANITFEFADQSVAVFDASKWFAHEAAQWAVQGNGDVTDGGSAALATRTVPTGRTAYIAGIGASVFGNADSSCGVYIQIVSALTAFAGGSRGANVVLDVPMRATTGQLISCIVQQISGATRGCHAAMWGWDEVD